LLSEGNTFVQLFIGLLKRVSKSDIQQCLLVWIADALTGESTTKDTALGVDWRRWVDRSWRTYTVVFEDETVWSWPPISPAAQVCSWFPLCQVVWLTPWLGALMLKTTLPNWRQHKYWLYFWGLLVCFFSVCQSPLNSSPSVLSNSVTFYNDTCNSFCKY